MSLGSARYIEPYGGEDNGDCGVAIVYRDHTEFLSYDQWNEKDRFSEDELKLIQRSVDRSKLWSRPTSNLPDAYRRYMHDFDSFPEGLDDGEQLAYSRERMKRILADLGQRIVRSLPNNIILKHDEDYQILAVMSLSSFFRNQFPFSPLICVFGAQNSGKSTVLETMTNLLYHGRFSHGYTGASVTTAVDRDQMSVCMDEIKLSLSGEKGQGVLEFLLGSCYSKSSIDRMDFDSKGLYVRSIYTTCMIALKGTDIPDDIRSRSLMIEMPLTKKGQRTRSVALRKFTEYAPGTSPEEILDDEYALMLITRQSEGTEFGNRELRGIWFDSFQRETLQMLETEVKPGSGVYLYSMIYDIDSVEINNRDEEIAVMALTIGDCMGFGRDVMKKISANAKQAIRQRSRTTSGRMFEAFAQIIRREFENSGIGYGEIGMADIIRIVRKIKISEVSNEYRNIRADESAGGELSDKALYQAFSDLGFVHTKRGMHNAYRVDSDDPGFPDQFARCLEIYAEDETRLFFAGFVASVNERGLA